MAKRQICLILAVLLLLSFALVAPPAAQAAGKQNATRAISIVFDNSGSMYQNTNQAWCRATYAMEVFASMLNEGDTLLIYPMNPFEIGGKEYTMKNPLKITDASQATQIRQIFTPGAGDTHIESIDCAIAGVQAMKADQKYMIVLSDGDVFYRDGYELGPGASIAQLDTYFQQANKDLTMMFLGIGVAALMPSTPQSDVFIKKQATNSEDVLSSLTDMCNLIFGRDTLPKSRIENKKVVNFDISMNKLIVFVQGENISDVKLVDGSGNPVGKQESAMQTKYSTEGCGAYVNNPDTSLQGMLVTYSDCSAGTYNLQYSGEVANVEVYYEPNADLDFVFTDAAGNTVDPQKLYEGDYMVSFGMKDGKTGKLIESDLLGSPKYRGSYSINGTEVDITHEGFSGSVNVPLKLGDEFKANLTVTYLSGYTIRKDSTDFGWPESGIKVAARPAGELRLEISGGQDLYSLQDLDKGEPYIAKVYYKGTQLTGSTLENVSLKWQPETSNALISKEFAEDHWKLYLSHKDPDSPESTVCGECTVTIHAIHSEQGTSDAMAQAPLTYNIRDDFSPLQLELLVPETYIVIDELDSSKPFEVGLKLNGKPLSVEDFSAVQLEVDSGDIEYTVTPKPTDSSFKVQLKSTDGLKEGKYPLKVTATYTDHIGRASSAEDQVELTLSNIPLWLRWLIWILLLIILLIIIWSILHIRVLPKKAHTTRRLSSMVYDGEDVTQSTNFMAEVKKNGTKMQAQYAGRKFGLSMDAKPGKESYLYKSAKRKSAEVRVESVKKFGNAKIQEAMIGSTKYVADENGKLVPALPGAKPFMLTNGMMVKYSGTIQDAGIDKDFEVTSKLNFRKK